MKGLHGKTIALTFSLACLLAANIASLAASGPALAAQPAMKTLAQLAKEEGSDPANMAKGTPRDFPVPVNSHDLNASNGISLATVKGVSVEQVESFYSEVFKQRHWDIKKKMELKYYIFFDACSKTGQCVSLDESSNADFASPAHILKFNFYKADELDKFLNGDKP